MVQEIPGIELHSAVHSLLKRYEGVDALERSKSPSIERSSIFATAATMLLLSPYSLSEHFFIIDIMAHD